MIAAVLVIDSFFWGEAVSTLKRILVFLVVAAAFATALTNASAHGRSHWRVGAPAFARAFGSGKNGPGFGFALGGSGSSLAGSTPVQPGPSAVAVDPATHTIYVASGFNSNGFTFGGDTVSVIDSRRCNADNLSGCKGPWPTITVGNLPSGVAVDTATDTVYVSNAGDGTVSVINGGTCNALTTTGCGQTPATVPVGSEPLGLFADDANHTVYVANFNDGTVSMFDSSTCDAADTAGCPSSSAPTVSVGGDPGDVDVDQSTHTVYVANITGLSAFDADSCNGSDESGCATVGQATVPCDFADFPFCGPFTAKVDVANDTIYESSGVNTVWVFDGRACNAGDLAGCASDSPGHVTPFREPGFESSVWLAVDAPLHTVYVTYEKDDTLVVIDANACSGSDLAGCATLKPPEIHTGAEPESLALDPQTQTLYAGNEISGGVSVIDAAQCDAATTAGCRARVPETPVGSDSSVTADPAVSTVYVANGTNTVSMLDAGTCNAHHVAGCGATPPTVTVGTYPSAIAVDPLTHTVYVTNLGSGTSGTISAFDDRSCNATNQAGCATVSTLSVPDGNPVDIAVNPKTDTLYVAVVTASGPNLISVFNGATCNASNTSDCGQSPINASTGEATASLAVNPVTNSIYVSDNSDGQDTFGDTVYMIDGSSCDAEDTSGCGNAPESIVVPSDPVFGDPTPSGIAVDAVTDTIYAADIYNGEGAGTVAVINGATCNGQNTNGCDQTPALAPAGFGAVEVAIDPTTNRVYATSVEDTSVTTINGNSCDGTTHTGCANTVTQPIVGDYPGSITVDPSVGTAYVADIEGVSVMPLSP